jgi:taurine---2-oxoglutarate transaminase
MTLAPAVAAIKELQRMDLINRAREMGKYLGDKLHALKPRHPSIGEVRGLGLFWALEMVKDQANKTPFNTKQDKVDGKVAVVERVAAEMMKRGVALPVDQLDQSLAIADAAIGQ